MNIVIGIIYLSTLSKLENYSLARTLFRLTFIALKSSGYAKSNSFDFKIAVECAVCTYCFTLGLSIESECC